MCLSIDYRSLIRIMYIMLNTMHDQMHGIVRLITHTASPFPTPCPAVQIVSNELAHSPIGERPARR
jgi:hypothetical protein